jgi:hypothetical protein
MMSSTSTTRLDSRLLAIGVLSITASVLFVGLMLVANQPAHARAMMDTGGDYKMITNQVTRTEEALVIIDAAAKRVIFYAFNFNTKSLVIINGLDLNQLPGPPEAGDPAGNQRRRRP